MAWPENTEWYDKLMARDTATASRLTEVGLRSESNDEQLSDRLEDLARRVAGLEKDQDFVAGQVDMQRKRIAALEQQCSTLPEPPRDLDRWVNEFLDLEGWGIVKWGALVDSYSHDARHIIGAYTDLAEATGDSIFRDHGTGLAMRLIAAYDRYPRNRNDDLVKNMVLPRVYALTGDERIKGHCKRVLDDVRDIRLERPSGEPVSYREWSWVQNRYPFSFGPSPMGRWQGQGTAVWLLASVADPIWATDMRHSWDYEMQQSPGTWGATWNTGEELYPHARNTFKAGRECYLTESVDPTVFLAAWERVRGRDQGLLELLVGVHQYIDGTTRTAPQLAATALYDGWVRLGQWSEDMRNVVDYTLKQESGPWHNLNDTDPARVRRAALLAGRARVEVLRG